MEEKFGVDDLTILYEDNQIIVVVKPQNVLTQSDDTGDIDLLSVVKAYLVEKYNKPGEAYVGMVHRLDRVTGGVMVFAKSSKAAARLCASIKNEEMEKYYLCVCEGIPKNKTGTLKNYLKKNETTNTVNVVPMLTEGAKYAELDYRVLETQHAFSLVKVKLITGRGHQIRVQMAAAGYPLFGDARYGKDARTFKNNIALWACELRFPHPVTGQIMTFIVYPPVEKAPWKAFDIAMHLNVGISVSPYDAYFAKKDLRDRT